MTTLFAQVRWAIWFGMVAGTLLPVSAAVIVYDASLDAQELDWGPRSVGLQRFDASLGTLQSVQLRLSGELSGTLEITNLDDKSGLIYALLAGTLNLVDDDDNFLLSLYLANSTPLFLEAYETATLSDMTASGLNTLLYAAPGDDLSTYIGSDQLTFHLSALDQSAASPGVLSFAHSVWGSAQVQVVYTYQSSNPENPSAVPEPGNILNFGFVFLTLMGYRRIRAARPSAGSSPERAHRPGHRRLVKALVSVEPMATPGPELRRRRRVHRTVGETY